MPNQATPNLPPPIGSPEQAEKYLQKLSGLIKDNKLEVFHTDLQKFELASIQDHYKLDVGSYEVEVSHSKQPDTGKDFYILLFNNIKKIQNNEESCSEKVILAYIHLTESQFSSFKVTIDDWLERKRIEEEAKRFKEAMGPIDQALENLEDDQATTETDTNILPNPPANKPIPTSDYVIDTYPPYPQNPNP